MLQFLFSILNSCFDGQILLSFDFSNCVFAELTLFFFRDTLCNLDFQQRQWNLVTERRHTLALRSCRTNNIRAAKF
ncbi:hypothetical protein H5410_046549 [Solanum commersonii]|uniref:Uncharacterized protein n=1 Tax=Solanum commersonii TaxID=4109 RepID=A0A9J5XCI9_SOLCO|nr:hypothetical protein H5410_046549 [Solanum commersonii]